MLVVAWEVVLFYASEHCHFMIQGTKSSYRKCPGGTQSGPRGYTAPAHLR